MVSWQASPREFQRSGLLCTVVDCPVAVGGTDESDAGQVRDRRDFSLMLLVGKVPLDADQ
jgi:hypothetical protein